MDPVPAGEELEQSPAADHAEPLARAGVGDRLLVGVVGALLVVGPGGQEVEDLAAALAVTQEGHAADRLALGVGERDAGAQVRTLDLENDLIEARLLEGNVGLGLLGLLVGRQLHAPVRMPLQGHSFRRLGLPGQLGGAGAFQHGGSRADRLGRVVGRDQRQSPHQPAALQVHFLRRALHGHGQQRKIAADQQQLAGLDVKLHGADPAPPIIVLAGAPEGEFGRARLARLAGRGVGGPGLMVFRIVAERHPARAAPEMQLQLLRIEDRDPQGQAGGPGGIQAKQPGDATDGTLPLLGLGDLERLARHLGQQAAERLGRGILLAVVEIVEQGRGRHRCRRLALRRGARHGSAERDQHHAEEADGQGLSGQWRCAWQRAAHGEGKAAVRPVLCDSRAAANRRWLREVSCGVAQAAKRPGPLADTLLDKPAVAPGKPAVPPRASSVSSAAHLCRIPSGTPESKPPPVMTGKSVSWPQSKMPSRTVRSTPRSSSGHATSAACARSTHPTYCVRPSQALPARQRTRPAPSVCCQTRCQWVASRNSRRQRR